MSLLAKLEIVRQLRHLGLSAAFVESVENFVSNDRVDRYFPTEEEQEEIIRRIEREQSRQDH